MTMRGSRAALWLAGVAVAIVAGGTVVRAPRAHAQSAALAQGAQPDSNVQLMSSPPVVRPEDVPRIARKGGNPNAPMARRGRKAKMIGHLMSLLTLVGAAGAVYAYKQIQEMRAAHARLQDTIAGQARQLAEIKAMLERSPRG